MATKTNSLLSPWHILYYICHRTSIHEDKYLMNLVHLYAPFEISLSESTVVRGGQGGEEEGQEDDDLKVTVISTFQKDYDLKVEVILACSRN